MDKQISEVFYSPQTGYISATKLYKKLHELGIKATHKQVDEFLKKQYTEQINKQYKRPQKHKYSKILGWYPGNCYQMDIMVYNRYEYHNYKYILCCIDVYSRYACCRAMTNRNMKTIMDNVNSIFDEIGTPNNINTDNEFNKTEFIKFCNDNNIKTWFSEPDDINKNSLIERFHRTLASMIQKYRTATGKYDWAKVLDDIVFNYNNSYHTSIRGEPYKVFIGKQKNMIEEQRKTQELGDFKIGDKVRVVIQKQTFDKNDVIKYSKEIYTISGLDGQRYELQNSEGNTIRRKFKYYELLKIKKVQQIPDDIKEEEVHLEKKRTRKIARDIKKEGLEEQNITRTLRSRKPTNQLEDSRYGKINY